MSNSTVFVVDDDEGSRSSMECLFGVHGINCLIFDSAEKFLEGRTEQPIGCIVTDLNMPGMSGLDLYQKTREMGWSIPTIILTAFGEVASCVRALKSGVLDYLEKQKHDQELANQAAKLKLKKLTNKENEVLELLVKGNSMKTIATEFGTSFQAVSRHRQRILEKIGVEGDVNLVRWVLDHRRATAAN